MEKMIEKKHPQSTAEIEAAIKNKKQRLHDAYGLLKQKVKVPAVLLGGLSGGLVAGYLISKRKKGNLKKKPQAPNTKKRAFAWEILDLVSVINVLKNLLRR